MFRNILARIIHKVAFFIPGGGTLRPWLRRLRGVQIGKNVYITQLVYIDELHPENVTIGDNSTIGLRASIFCHFYWGPRRSWNEAKIIIKRGVFVGPPCVILSNVGIGEGAVIRAGTVVRRNVPLRTLWGYPPAQDLGIATIPLTAQHP
jgi:acetyltransferase-like isoleucine patch superfamily enzyme